LNELIQSSSHTFYVRKRQTQIKSKINNQKANESKSCRERTPRGVPD